MQTFQKIAIPFVAIVIFVALWELLVWANNWPNYVMASPSDLPAAYAKFWNLFLIGSWQTLGMAFQNPVLLEWRSILDNVILPLEIVAPTMSRAQKVARAEELLALVGLSGFEAKRPSELSGGMRQRASLCRSIVHKPDVLIMDEPFGALDAFTREDLWQTMHELRAKEPFTAVLITHDLRESVYLGDQVFVLSGRPATTQFVLDVQYPMQDGPRKLDGLYTPECSQMLATLREQIKIAQGRQAETADH
ncbi:Bicarbonate transport ATP-binding protein CmpD [Tropicibacter naphthalenivorans]|uniref:Bicarbonate transport ATP-binding protein CmpD n=1 Tax=Tropicibacter naphthalenivorans TaxID=441103 RepID=A0A0P1GK69_9RHOB|nr:ATP-binding cassette domain-containing protein [Tropicibacter naphthalenivorans]CUH82567.1 Bicarbonate transport ATP-binding protein CmpD [Tropicibacter naphthalenivorans]